MICAVEDALALVERGEKMGRRVFLLASTGVCATACGVGSPVVGDSATGADVGQDVLSPGTDDGIDGGVLDSGGEVVTVDVADRVEPRCNDGDWIELGLIANYPVGVHLVDPTLNLIITRDAGGIWAMRRTCNHQFGQIEARASGENRCTNTQGGASLHGATWDKDGIMIIPPGMLGAARFNLDNYAMRVCEGTVYVNPSVRVEPGTRAPIS